MNNRRIGIVDFTITKTWNDKDKPESISRPEAYFMLTEANGKANFAKANDGTVTVQLEGSNNVIPLYTDEGTTPLECDVADDGSAIMIAVNRDADANTEETYRIYGLPKYDGSGEVANYKVEETGVTSPYASSVEQSDYEVANRHFHDSQTYKFDNRLTGVKSVQFYKVWKDKYVYETLNQRPDIYLTLYKWDYKENKLKQVDGYIHYVWTPTDGENVDGEYNYTCTIENLQKYDSKGREIKYYATEDMSADWEALDYGKVELSAPDNVGTFNPYINPNDDSMWQDGALLPTGSDWAVIEDGTFTNALGGSITVEGTKLWENIPTGYAITDLPEITVYLQQRVAPANPDDAWEDMNVVQCGEGTEGLAPAGDNDSYGVTNAIAWTTLLGESYADKDSGMSWSFTMTKPGENNQDSIENRAPFRASRLMASSINTARARLSGACRIPRAASPLGIALMKKTIRVWRPTML